MSTLNLRLLNLIIIYAVIGTINSHPWLNKKVQTLEETSAAQIAQLERLESENAGQTAQLERLESENQELMAEMLQIKSDTMLSLANIERLEQALERLEVDSNLAIAATAKQELLDTELNRIKSDTTLQIEVMKFETSEQFGELGIQVADIKSRSMEIVDQQEQVESDIVQLRDEMEQKEIRNNETIEVLQSALSEVRRGITQNLEDSESGIREEIEGIKEDIQLWDMKLVSRSAAIAQTHNETNSRTLGNIVQLQYEMEQHERRNNETMEVLQSGLSEVRRQIDQNQEECESGIRDEIESIKEDIFPKFPELSCKWYNVPNDVSMDWRLGMNLNPGDGHIMDYTIGWADDSSIGTDDTAFSKDYLNQTVWQSPANYIAIARHQQGTVDAVKVFKFTEEGTSLLDRFKAMDPGRMIVTEGGPIQEYVGEGAQYMEDDPIFSVGGDLAFNWRYSNNGHRIVLTGGNLSPEWVNDNNSHGLGNHIQCDPKTGVPTAGTGYRWRHEISAIQDCDWYSGCRQYKIVGTDHSPDTTYYRSSPVYGNYAIFVSEESTKFPEPGSQLQLKITALC